jgi:hypothetical protein
VIEGDYRIRRQLLVDELVTGLRKREEFKNLCPLFLDEAAHDIVGQCLAQLGEDPDLGLEA